MAQDLISNLQSIQTKQYKIIWNGTKIPRGLVVGGTKVVWTQNGMITGEGGANLGYYDRILEWGGLNKDEHQMIISVNDEIQFDGAKIEKL